MFFLLGFGLLTHPPEILIKQVFGAKTEMVDVARCESSISQYDKDGNVLVSKTSDIGIYQINQVHWYEAKKLGYDITTPLGNIMFAKYLYDKNGVQPWYKSVSCHGHNMI